MHFWYLPFDEKAGAPRFKECAKHPHIDEKGYALFHDGEYVTNEQMNNKKFLKLVNG